MAFPHSQQAGVSTSEPIDISPVVWSQYKETIEDLYINQNLPLNIVMAEMESVHHFRARYDFDLLCIHLSLMYPVSIPQYKRKLHDWHFKKNKKSTEWQAINKSLKRRSLASEDALVIDNGRDISRKRLKRALARHCLPSLVPNQGL